MMGANETTQGNGENLELGVPPGVGLTALNVARGRAVESRRADRLFNDPFAQEFVTAAGPAFAETLEQMHTVGRNRKIVRDSGPLDFGVVQCV